MGIESFPTDNLGMPLSVIIPDPRRREEGEWDRHHAWHFARHFLLPSQGATPGSRVVRFTKKQLTPIEVHRRIHRELPMGVQRPISKDDEVRHVLFNLAGRVSGEALKVIKGKVTKVELNRYDRLFLRIPGVINVDKTGSRKVGAGTNVETEISDFLLGYIASMGLPETVRNNQLLVEEFTETKDDELRDEQAKLILRAAAQVALSPWEALYTSERRESALSIDAPADPADVFFESIRRGVSDLGLAVQGMVDVCLENDLPVGNS